MSRLSDDPEDWARLYASLSRQQREVMSTVLKHMVSAVRLGMRMLINTLTEEQKRMVMKHADQ